MLWDHYQESLRWRILYLAWTRKGETGHTVLVQDVPGNPSGTIVGRVNDVRCFKPMHTESAKLRTGQCQCHADCHANVHHRPTARRTWFASRSPSCLHTYKFSRVT